MFSAQKPSAFSSSADSRISSFSIRRQILAQVASLMFPALGGDLVADLIIYVFKINTRSKAAGRPGVACLGALYG